MGRKPDSGTKKCARCHVAKPLTDFGANKSRRDGRAVMCRQCKRAADRGEKRPRRGEEQAIGAPSAHLEAPPEPRSPEFRRPSGRPSTLTPEVIDRVSAILSRGHTRRAAARGAGVPESTLTTWLRDAADSRDPMRRALHEAVEAAEGEGEFKLLEIVRAAAETDPQQAKWILERRYSSGDETWARKDHLAVSGGDKPLEIDVVRDAVARKVAAIAAGARVSAGGSDRGTDGTPTGTETPPPDRGPDAGTA